MSFKGLLLLTVALLLFQGTPLYAGKAGGEKVFRDKECGNCHQLKEGEFTLSRLWERKGPDFSYAGNKYREEWVAFWLQKPKRIRPAGLFYGNHIKPGVKRDETVDETLPPHPSLNKEEALKVASYLMTFKGKSELIKKGDYKEGSIALSMGEMFFDKFRGCLACHKIEPGYGGLSGPEVYTVAHRLQADYLVSYMRDPQSWDKGIFMPSGNLNEADLQKFVHYFRALSKEVFE